jgi:hypothetical protein
MVCWCIQVRCWGGNASAVAQCAGLIFSLWVLATVSLRGMATDLVLATVLATSRQPLSLFGYRCCLATALSTCLGCQICEWLGVKSQSWLKHACQPPWLSQGGTNSICTPYAAHVFGYSVQRGITIWLPDLATSPCPETTGNQFFCRFGYQLATVAEKKPCCTYI